MASEYIDVRHYCEEYDRLECWNCANRVWRWRRAGPWNVCKECFMGQRQHDHDSPSTTPEGYTDYRKLWYGDVSIEEAKRRFDNIDIGPHPSVRKREVRL